MRWPFGLLSQPSRCIRHAPRQSKQVILRQAQHPYSSTDRVVMDISGSQVVETCWKERHVTQRGWQVPVLCIVFTYVRVHSAQAVAGVVSPRWITTKDPRGSKDITSIITQAHPSKNFFLSFNMSVYRLHITPFRSVVPPDSFPPSSLGGFSPSNKVGCVSQEQTGKDDTHHTHIQSTMYVCIYIHITYLSISRRGRLKKTPPPKMIGV